MIKNNSTTHNHVEFVNYTGAWPNLCRGILTLKIDGVTHIFGDYDKYDQDTGKYEDGCHDYFWCSGGSCGFTDGYADSYCQEGEWIIDPDDLPEELRCYAQEIDEVFNTNVEHGCCGGCL